MKYVLALCALVSMTSLASLPAFADCGTASYYGGSDGLCGSKTASGRRFNCNEMTAAHRSLPFGTVINVTHGSRTVAVTITDRGPFVRGRILDLSIGAAKALGMGGTGHVCW